MCFCIAIDLDMLKMFGKNIDEVVTKYIFNLICILFYNYLQYY